MTRQRSTGTDGNEPEPELGPLLNRREAAAMLGVSTDTLDRLRAAGEIPTIAVAARSVRFARQDLCEYLRRRRFPGS